MRVPFLIIDGYNLMHAAGIARRSYGVGDLEQCRRRLNQLVVSLLRPEALARATIVYDAFESPSNDQRNSEFRGLRIVFAPRGSDADSEIERMLNRHSAPRQVVVVSGDHRLHKAASRRKAVCVDSEEFLSSLQVESELSAWRTMPPEAPTQTDSEPAPPGQKPADPTLHFDSDYLKEIEDEFLS